MVKICAIGDPHGDLEKVKKAPIKDIDFYILTGDLGKADLARKRFFENIERRKKGLPELESGARFEKQAHMQVHNSTLDVLKYLSKHASIYSIQGNVGLSTRVQARKTSEENGIKFPSTMESIDKLSNVHVVKNRLRNINGLRIGFLEYFTDTCWVKEFKPSEYKKSMSKAKKKTDKARKVLNSFGKDLDILVCHQPPYGYLDKVNFPGIPAGWKGKHAGSKAILEYIKKYQPKYVLCGHIHEGEGKAKIGKSQVYNLGVASNIVLDI